MSRPSLTVRAAGSATVDDPRLCSPTPPPVPRYGVVDIGSNSVRLVIFAGLESTPTALFNEKVLCGLGRDLASNGRLNPKGVDQALANIRRFVSLAESLGVAELELLATAAVREAEDGEDFVAAVESMSGYEVRVISGETEAMLSAQGVIWGATRASGIVGDLGGGSLELIHVQEGEIQQKATLPLGPLRLLNHWKKDPKGLRQKIDKTLDTLPWLRLADSETFFAVGGAWRSLAKIQMDVTDYPLRVLHGYSLPRRDVRNLARLISQQTQPSLLKIKGINAKRLETIPLASIVLARVLSAVRPKQVTFSTYGLREGWLFEQLPEDRRLADPLLGAAREAMDRDPRFADRSEALYEWTAPIFSKESEEETRLREAACILCDLAWRAHPEYRADAVMDQLLHWPLLAANHHERVFLALTLYWRYGGGPAAATYKRVLDERAQERAQVLGLALRLADSVSGGTTEGLTASALEFSKGNLNLILPKDGAVPHGEAIDKRYDQLRKFVEGQASLLNRKGS